MDMFERINPERAKIMYDRITNRIESGRSLPSVTLPLSKADFPKVLCLDMMHWVALSRAHHNIKNPTPEAIAALDAIRSATKKKRLVVPALVSNIHEATEHADEQVRERLALFMVNLSKNFSVVNYRVTEDQEIAHAVEKHFLGTSTLPPIRPGIVQWGFTPAVIGRDVNPKTTNKRKAAMIKQFSREPEMSVVSLIGSRDREAIKAMRQREEESLALMESARKTDVRLSRIERWSWATYWYLKDGQGRVAEAIAGHLAARGIPRAAYLELLEDPERRLRFIGDLTQHYVHWSLLYERDRSGNDPYQANDFKDAPFLAQAIAYANIVVTEKRWTQHAKNTGIAKRYGTSVFKSLKDLPDALAKEGCL